MNQLEAVIIIINDFLMLEYNYGVFQKNLKLMEVFKKKIFKNTEINVPKIETLETEASFEKRINPAPWATDKPLLPGKNIENRIKTLHENLSPIWKELRRGLDLFRSGQIYAPPSRNNNPGNNFKNRPTGFIISGYFDFRSGFINYGYSQDTLNFLELLKGIPLNLFRACKTPDCRNYFVSKRSDRRYCSRTCGGKHRVRRYRKKKEGGGSKI